MNKNVELSLCYDFFHFWPWNESPVKMTHKLLKIIHEFPDVILITVQIMILSLAVKSHLDLLELFEGSSHGHFSQNLLEDFPMNFLLIKKSKLFQ